MLTTDLIEQLLNTIPRRTIGVVGDLFLDRYLDLDATLTEPSIETGLDAYQVTRVRSYPGAAGTVINNLAALGVRRIIPISMIGDDGEGYELRQALQRRPGVEIDNVIVTAERRTPTYTKPMLMKSSESPRELNRLDIKNRVPLPADVESSIIERMDALWKSCGAWLVLDQVSEAECGVITSRVRDHLSQLGKKYKKIVIADSRERIGLFRNVCLKPNQRECMNATGLDKLHDAVRALVRQTGRAVVCTQGEKGMLVADPDADPIEAPGFPVTGPIDIVGAGDSSSAALACALACGIGLLPAAEFGNLVASITIQQIGVTGTASPEQVRARWREIDAGGPVEK